MTWMSHTVIHTYSHTYTRYTDPNFNRVNVKHFNRNSSLFLGLCLNSYSRLNQRLFSAWKNTLYHLSTEGHADYLLQCTKIYVPKCNLVSCLEWTYFRHLVDVEYGRQLDETEHVLQVPGCCYDYHRLLMRNVHRKPRSGSSSIARPAF